MNYYQLHIKDSDRNYAMQELSNSELMKHIRGAIAHERGWKQAQPKVKPIIEWDELLQTKLISKPCFV